MRTIAILCAVFTLVPQAHGDIALHALRATVRIDGGGQSGTAFVVGLPPADGAADRGVLVTAAHALENMKGNTCTVSFRESRAEGFVRHDARAEIRSAGMPRWVRHPRADVAVLPIDVPEKADVEPFPVGQLADAAAFARGEVVVGQGVTVACFPAKTEANAAGWPILRRGTVATHPLTPVDQLPTFFVDYAHFGGDSGSAVVVDRGGRALVAGIVVAMQRQTDRVTSPFEEKKVHTPLGLAIAVPANRILETIDRWERGTGRQPPAAN